MCECVLRDGMNMCRGVYDREKVGHVCEGETYFICQ